MVETQANAAVAAAPPRPGELWCWRHPRALAAAGRCIGRTDLAIDPRKAKRLAQRIRAAARRHGLPRVVWVSPLQRARAVGDWLVRWGWRVQVDARLCELDFGRWDGQPWSRVPWHEVQQWQADLLHHAPGGGEPLAHLAQRARAFAAEAAEVTKAGPAPRLVVGHAGWITALAHVAEGCTQLDAATWPAAPRHGQLRRLEAARGPD